MSILDSLFSSYAEIHGFLMGVVFGLLFATVRYLSDRRIAAALAIILSLFVVVSVVANIRLSPWEGWWHVWYILVPATIISYLAAVYLPAKKI